MNHSLSAQALTANLVLFCFSTFWLAAQSSNSQWPSFRGDQARGVADGHPLPHRWDVKTGQNVLWSTPVPGLAHSSPIIWGDRLFVTSVVSSRSTNPDLKVGLYGDIAPVEESDSHSWKLYCLDRKTGKVLWERTAHEGVPRVKRHPKSTHANSTPATDGQSVVAFFGSEGLYCYSVNGEPIWKKDLGVLNSNFFRAPDAQWGFASSPVIHDGMVFIQADVHEGSFLAAFDLQDGREIWRTPRNDVPTWSTPTVSVTDQRAELIVNGWKQIGGYDLKTGEPIWWMSGGGDIPVPTPIVAGGLVFITNAHGPEAPIYAIRLGAKGDLTAFKEDTPNASIVWTTGRGGAYMQTPLVYGEYLYNCRDNGVLSCYRADTGEQIYQERLGAGSGGFSASAVAADGKLYYSSETGDIYVVKAGPQFELLATNSFDEVTMSTPAISEGRLYFRTRSRVVAIGER